MKNRLPALLLALGLPLTVQAESLQDLYQDALRNDTRVLAAEARAAASQQQVGVARGALLPQLDFSAALYANNQGYNSSSGSRSDDKSNSNTQSLTLSQALYRQDLRARYSSAELQSQASLIRVDAARAELLRRVATAVVDLQLAEHELQFKRYENQVLQQQLQQALAMKQEGMATITDVQQYQSELDLSSAGNIEAEDRLQQRKHELAEITGHFPLQLTQLQLPQQSRINSILKRGLNHWLNQTLAHNADIAAARLDLAVAEADIDTRNAERLPRLAMVANVARDETRLSNRDITNTDSSIGLEFDLPVFSGFSTTAKIRQAEHDRSRVEADSDGVTRRALTQLRVAYNAMDSGARRVVALQRAMQSTEQALAGVKQAARLGTRTALDVNLAVKSWYDARLAYTRARYNYILNGITVLSLAGALEQQDLTLLSR